MSNTFPDDCDHCGKDKATHILMIESDKDWTRSETKKVCSECIIHYQGTIIEAWTFQEWINEE